MQRLEGSFSAQADRGSTAIVNVFQSASAVEIDGDTLAEANALLDKLPLDSIPAPAGLPPHSHMPLRRNALFVGREADLRALAAALKAVGTAAVGQVPAVTGLGGLGKSQLASEFVYRYGQFFAGGVFWLSFADPGAIASEIAACGGPRALNLHSGYDGLPIDAQVGLVSSAWHSELPRLLVLDNCEEEPLLEAWLPRGGGCRVIVTSRRSDWGLDLGVQGVPLGLLARSDSIALLRKHRPDLAEGDASLNAIAEELGNLPLALHLAGSFLTRYRHAEIGEPARYLEALRAPDLLKHKSLTIGGRSPTKHEQHVANTFAVSYERLDGTDQTDRLALAALPRAACFAPGEPIPRALLISSLGLPADDSDATMRAEDALGRLGQLGLLAGEADGALLLHRLLAAFVKDTTEDLFTARAAVEQAVRTEAGQLISEGYPAPLLAWQTHLRAVTEAAVQEKSDRAVGLLTSLGSHLKMVGDFVGARAAFERALKVAETTFGPNHSVMATCLNNLGSMLQTLNDLPGAKAAYERALRIDEVSRESSHTSIATRANNLGSVLYDLGELTGARAAVERALKIVETTLGPDHPTLAVCMNNLGEVLRDMGQLARARATLERALKIAETALGSDHPTVAICLDNLGVVLRDLAELTEARAAHERALRINEDAYGADHPLVATTLDSLGLVLQDLGDLPGARVAHGRALRLTEACYGPNHPKVATCINNAGLELQQAGELAGAKVAYERSLKIAEAALGPNHPKVAAYVENLGSVLWEQGDILGAKAAHERALEISEATYGPDHPTVGRCLNNLGLVLQHLGEHVGAKVAYERALRLTEACYGPNHPKVAICINNVGLTLRQVGNLVAAKAAFKRALKIVELRYGTDHPTVATFVDNLGLALADMGDLAGARRAHQRALMIDEAKFGRDHMRVAIRSHNLGLVFRDLGEFAEARAAIERALKINEAAFGPDHPSTRLVRATLAAVQS